PDQHVEDDELRRYLRRQLLDARLRRMEARLHRVEVDRTVARDHDLAVECGPRRKQLAERAELGEVAQQRTLVPRPQRELAARILEHPAEAVPFRLVLPALAVGELADELGLHRGEGDDRGRHAPKTRLHAMKRVAVTGIGAVTPLGLDVPSTWRAAQAGESGIDWISAFDTDGLPVRVAAEVKGFDP